MVLSILLLCSSEIVKKWLYVKQLTRILLCSSEKIKEQCKKVGKTLIN